MKAIRIQAALAATCALAIGTPALADPAAQAPADAKPAAAASTLPLRYVERPLTLPQGTLSPQLGLGDAHFELSLFTSTLAVNAIATDLGAAYGVTDDLTVDLTPLTMLFVRTDAKSTNQTKVYYGTFRLGGTYRFLHTDGADVGARFEFGATGASDTIHMTAGVPVVLRLASAVRVDTGFAFTAILPTKGGQADAAIASVGATLPVPTAVSGDAGIPVQATVQIVDAFYAGLDTGFGVASFRNDVGRSCFMPLGFRAGYTIGGDHPVADVAAGFHFPFFLLGADSSPPLTEYWHVGIGARAYLPL